MAYSTIAITQVGGFIAGSGGGTGLPPGSGAPPSTSGITITVTGFINPITNTGYITASVTPPSPVGTYVGCHLYLEIPDQSAGQAWSVGSSTTNPLGGPNVITGAWATLDLGKQPGSGPWSIQFPAPFTIDATQDIPCRLYANPYSAVYEATLVQANQAGASPNQTFTLTSLDSGSKTSGTNVTPIIGGDGGIIAIVATVLSPVNVTGKLETPITVDVSDTPPNTPGWVAQLVLTLGNADPTIVANQQVVGSIITQAGPVYSAPGDGINVPHSFALDTPTDFTNATIWLQAGLKNAAGSYSWNNIVPGITPSWSITYGSTTGTTDASAIMTATIAAEMAITNKLLGLAAMGVANSFLGPAAVATINIAALAVTNPLLGALAVQAGNLASSSVTAAAIAALAVGGTAIQSAAITAAKIAALAVGTAAIQNAAITNALIANLAVGAAQIQNATITNAQIANATIAGANIASATIVQGNIANLAVGTAQIQNLAVTDAKVNDMTVNKLTAGTANFTATATFAYGGSSLAITSSGITIADSSSSLVVTSSAVTVSNGSYSATLSASSLVLAYSGGPNLSLFSSSIYLTATANDYIQVEAGTITITSSGLSTTISGNTISAAQIAISGGVSILIGTISFPLGAGSTSVGSGGSASVLPSTPAGYLTMNIAGTSYKFPYYHV